MTRYQLQRTWILFPLLLTLPVFSLLVFEWFPGGHTTSERYFGNTALPAVAHFVFGNAREPATLDPALQFAAPDWNIIENLLEGLVVLHPITSQPIAGMATHYEVTADGLRYTFFLRGHPEPRGTRLPDIESLPWEYSRGLHAPADSIPARWSDLRLVTSQDFVYAWRRYADPKFGYWGTADMALIEHGDEVISGKSSPDALGIEAPDEFTFVVHLRSRAPWFVQRAASLLPVPKHVVERFRLGGNESAWTKPGNMVGNGPFLLDEWRHYDALRLRRNGTYYMRDLVAMEKVTFLPVSDSAAISLFRSGAAQGLFANAVPVSIIPSLRSKADFQSNPVWEISHLVMNLREPPFNNRMVRLAINMAIDKSSLAKFTQEESLRNLTVESDTYGAPKSVLVDIGNRTYDVLAYDPDGARAALAEAGYPGGAALGGRRLRFAINVKTDATSIAGAQILAYQLSRTLNVDAFVAPVESAVLFDGIFADHFSGMGYWGDSLFCGDPFSFLSYLPSYYGTGWDGRVWFEALDLATNIRNPALRLKQLAESEANLLREMPLIPLGRASSNYLLKPYVQGWTTNPSRDIFFRYVWFDRNWSEGKAR